MKRFLDTTIDQTLDLMANAFESKDKQIRHSEIAMEYSHARGSNTIFDQGLQVLSKIQEAKRIYDKLSFNMIISYLMINLENYKKCLFFHMFERLCSFLNSKGIINNRPLRKEATLFMRDNVRHNILELLSHDFRDDFITNITKSNVILLQSDNSIMESCLLGCLMEKFGINVTLIDPFALILLEPIIFSSLTIRLYSFPRASLISISL